MDLPTEQYHTDLSILETFADAEASGDPWLSPATIDAMFLTPDDSRQWRVRAEEEGWIRTGPTINAGRAITPEGAAKVEKARNRRNDRGLRRRTLHNHLLGWVDANATSTSQVNLKVSGFSVSAYGWFEGKPFNYDEVNDATKHLEDLGLIQCIRAFGPPTLGITSKGQECAAEYDCDVAKWQAAQRSPAGGAIVQLDVDGESHTIAVAAGDHASASALSINIDKAAELAQAALRAVTALNLGDDVEAALSDVESRESGRVKRGLGRLRELAADTSTGAAGQVIATGMLGMLGVL